MAVPSSGEIKLGKIYNEIDVDDYNGINSEPTNLSLRGLSIGTYGTINTSSSSYPNSTAPHSMSEFHSYDHDATTSISATDYWDDTLYYDDYIKTRYDANWDDSYGVGSGTTVTNVGTQSATGTLINMTEGSNWSQRATATSPGYWIFNGSDERIMATAPVSDVFTGSGYTFCYWIRPTVSGNSLSGVVSELGDSSNYAFKLAYNRGRLYCSHYHGSTSTKTDLPGADANGVDEWQFIAISCYKAGNTYYNTMWTGTGANDQVVGPVDEYSTTTGPATLSSPNISFGADASSSGGDYVQCDIGAFYALNRAWGSGSGGNAKETAFHDNHYPIYGY